jgi:diguanylate cyclase (GGDEF)-like protein
LLSGSTRAEDIVVRYGGDEFLLLLPGVERDQAVQIADRMVKLFGQHARRAPDGLVVSMSAGVASMRRDSANSGHDLIAQADRALYKAKRRGKNAVADYSAAGQSG